MITEKENGILVDVRIVPNSSKNDLIIEDSGTIKVKVTAQPVENKANKALIEYLSKLLKVPKTKINITKGETSKDKTLFIEVSDKEKREQILKLLR